MPSHSSSGGNFSSGHSGGGFSGGGFSSSGHSGFRGGFRPRRPIHFHFFGHPVVVTTGAQSGYIIGIFLFIFMLVFSVISLGTLSSTKADLAEYKNIYAEIKQDSEYRLQIISKADAGEAGYGKTLAEFSTDIHFENSYGYEHNVDHKETGVYEYITDISGLPKFYIIYSFTIDDEEYKGETFAQFMSSDVNEYGGRITIAYHIDGGKVSSINYDYSEDDNFELSEARIYIRDAESSIKTNRVVAYVFLGITVITVVILILCFIKTIKTSKEKALEEKEEKEQKKLEEAESKKKRYCTYCGAPIEDDDRKCPNCGSTHFDKK